MAQTIDDFITQVRDRGVQAGKAEADTLLQKAQDKAKGIVEDAETKAKAIIADADATAKRSTKAMVDEAALACRDTLKHLEMDVNRAVSTLLSKDVTEALLDDKAIKKLVVEMANDKADVVVVSDALLGHLKGKLAQEVEGGLRMGGFELHRKDGTVVEVTEESIRESFMTILSPKLKEALKGGE